MRCRVRLERMAFCDEMLQRESSRLSMEPPSPTDSHPSFNWNSGHTPTVNRVKETRARPLCKKSFGNSSNNIPLAKVESDKTVERQTSVLETLRNCRNCKVRLVDCWKGKPLPSYLNSWKESSCFSEYDVSTPGKRLKKKKNKDAKVNTF